jgi:hypothetical protein
MISKLVRKYRINYVRDFWPWTQRTQIKIIVCDLLQKIKYLLEKREKSSLQNNKVFKYTAASRGKRSKFGFFSVRKLITAYT